MSENESYIKKGFSFKNNQFEVLKQIGEGGFGVVFLVKDKFNQDEERLKF